MEREGIFLSLGSNLGNRLQHVTDARNEIEKHVGKIVFASQIYETPPWGFESEIPFLNQVLRLQTPFSAQEILKYCFDIEQLLGRIRTGSGYTSRTMDIDLLFYHQQILNEEFIQVPHPKIHLRRFVLEPLAEIAPGFIHPVLHQSVSKLLLMCPDTSDCTVFKE